MTLPVDRLLLTFLPRQQRVPVGRTQLDLERDLLRGVWIAREPKNIYRLGGADFELRVRRRPGQDGGRILAVVQTVDAARSAPRRTGRIRPGNVEFCDIWDERACDLEPLEEAARAHARHRTRPGRRPVGQATARAHHQLQGAVRQQYGELRTLIELLERRPEPVETELVGTVVDLLPGGRRGRRVVLALNRPAPADLRLGRARIVGPSGTSHRTRITSVRPEHVELAEPDGRPSQLGETMRVEVIRPFGLRRNKEALESFLEGRIEGNWDDLATLLCRPRELRMPTQPEPARFHCAEDSEPVTLNEEQRRAVAGAIGSPHAYLVQGPPGTGKTEVISEIVRQLTGRGERVLLLAPSHVAVDEVLRRVGRKPGIRPLRISYDGDRVDEDLRGFLPDNLGLGLAAGILRPAGRGQAIRWQRELVAVEEWLAAAATLRAAERRRAEALDAVREAAAESTAAEDVLHHRTAELSGRIAARTRDEADARADRADAEVEAVDAARAEGAVLARSGAALVDLRDAAERLASAEAAAAVASGAQWRHDTAVTAWLADQDVRLARASDHHARIAAGADDAARRAAGAYQELARAGAELASAEARQSAFGRLAGRVGRGEVVRLRQYVIGVRTDSVVLADLAARWEFDRRSAVDAYDRLLRDGREREAKLRADAADRAARRRGADTAADRVRQEFVRCLRALTDAGPAYEVRPDAWIRLGRSVATALDDVVAAALRMRPLPTTGDRRGATAETTALLGTDALETVVRGMATVIRRRETAEAVLARARIKHEEGTAFLDQARAEFAALAGLARTAADRLVSRQVEVDRCLEERGRAFVELQSLGGDTAGPDLDTDVRRMTRRRQVLPELGRLEARWRELVADRTDGQLADDVRHSLVRATNLVCATTKGIVGRGSDVVRSVDFDTLIVDEASRVTDSEFLIGAVRARRWVLVGDEHQLPPHVDQEDEHFLHALAALDQVDRGEAPSLDDSVTRLGDLWREDEQQHLFRSTSVREKAAELVHSGQWPTEFRTPFAEGRGKFDRGRPGEADRALLGAMARHLVRSLFERTVPEIDPSIRTRLEWQRRMIAPLAQLVDGPVYGGRYRSAPAAELAARGVTPLVTARTFQHPFVFLDTSRHPHPEDAPAPSGHGFVNELEQDHVVRLCTLYDRELSDSGAERISVSVLSFYKAQAQALERRLRAIDLPLFDWEVIDVIDAIQGQQSDLVMVSFTRAKPGGFGPRYGQWLQDVRRLTVACTRARRALVLVGHGDTLRRLGLAADPARRFYDNLFRLVEAGGDFERKWGL